MMTEPPMRLDWADRPEPDLSEDAAALAFDRRYHSWCIFNGIAPNCGPECLYCGITRGWRKLARAVYGVSVG